MIFAPEIDRRIRPASLNLRTVSFVVATRGWKSMNCRAANRGRTGHTMVLPIG